MTHETAELVIRSQSALKAAALAYASECTSIGRDPVRCAEAELNLLAASRQLARAEGQHRMAMELDTL